MRTVYEPGFAGYMHSVASEFIPWRSRRKMFPSCHPRISYSNNKFETTECQSSGFADSATVSLVGCAIGCANMPLGLVSVRGQ
jgi:hypothetical protein